jgi:hypothetical protein
MKDVFWTKEDLRVEMDRAKLRMNNVSMNDYQRWKKLWREYLRVRDAYIRKGGCLI